MLAGNASGNDRAADRIDGVRQALRAARLSLPHKALIEAPYTLQAARQGTRTLLAADPAPTALVCGNDVLAWGALLECQALGVDVPRTLSVVGFDDLEISRHWQPALTTMHVPTEHMWTLAADYLLDRLNQRVGEALQQEVEVELLVRGSTAPPPGPRSR
jgi:LacI family transcriptional regulator